MHRAKLHCHIASLSLACKGIYFVFISRLSGEENMLHYPAQADQPQSGPRETVIEKARVLPERLGCWLSTPIPPKPLSVQPLMGQYRLRGHSHLKFTRGTRSDLDASALSPNRIYRRQLLIIHSCITSEGALNTTGKFKLSIFMSSKPKIGRVPYHNTVTGATPGR